MNEVPTDSSESIESLLPPEFDAAIYRTRNPDLRRLDEVDLTRHYSAIGATEGRSASSIDNRQAFMALIPLRSSVLEVGPFANPLLRGSNVKYLDVLPTELLRNRAKVHGVDPDRCPHIDFVSATGDLSVVTQQFDAVLSAHVIEHQPDLVHHLRGVASVLNTGGRYYLAVPDKRYCFDHFIATSSIAECIAAHLQRLSVHSVQSVIEHGALTTHNDAKRHWAGDHGEPVYKASLTRIRGAVDSYLRSKGSYLDVHAWQFTPESFRDLMQVLFDMRLSPLTVRRVYGTVAGSNEFYAVLENTGQEAVALCDELPAQFEEHEYLLANPDVARAGMNAAEHYLAFGRREGRKLRP